MAPRWIDRLITTRRLLRALERLAIASEQQAALLLRIANRVAPELPPDPSKLDLLHTGPSFGRDHEFARIEDFRTTMLAKLKREPTEDEIVAWLDGLEQTLD